MSTSKIQNAMLLALFPMDERLVQLTALTNYLSFLKVASSGATEAGVQLAAAFLRDDIVVAERLLEKLNNAYDPTAPEAEEEL